jgi:hypothetical protein
MILTLRATNLQGSDRSAPQLLHGMLEQGAFGMYDLNWSHAEKAIARRAFDKALGNELEAVIREAKSRAGAIKDASELWDLESWLTERRRQIYRTYDYRYSILPLVLASLLRDGKLTEDDLKGLKQEKLDLICKGATVI